MEQAAAHKNIFRSKGFYIILGILVVGGILLLVFGKKGNGGTDAGGKKSSSPKPLQAGQVITRVVNGKKQRLQVQPDKTVIDLDTGQQVHIVGSTRGGN